MTTLTDAGGDRRQITSMVRWLLIMSFVVIGYLILQRLAPIVAPLLAAAGVAYLLDGWVDRLEARGMRRVTAVALLLGGFVILMTGLLLVAIPLVTVELKKFLADMPRMVDAATAWLSANTGIEMPESWRAYFTGGEFQAVLGDAAGPLAKFTAIAVDGLFAFLTILAELLLIPVFAFYFMVDWDHIVARIRRFVPPRHRPEVGSIFREIDSAISVWIRGQLTVISILAVLYAVAFKLIGLHLGIVIGVTVGLLTIIPFLGTFVGAALTLGVMLFDWQGYLVLGLVVGTFVFLHILEAGVLTPKIVGKKVGLGELGALFAVLAGGKLLGFTGVLLAVPIAASVAVLVRRALRYYEKSEFFNEGAELAASGGHSVPHPFSGEEE